MLQYVIHVKLLFNTAILCNLILTFFFRCFQINLNKLLKMTYRGQIYPLLTPQFRTKRIIKLHTSPESLSETLFDKSTKIL